MNEARHHVDDHCGYCNHVGHTAASCRTLQRHIARELAEIPFRKNPMSVPVEERRKRTFRSHNGRPVTFVIRRRRPTYTTSPIETRIGVSEHELPY